jgi:hypothetical protein
MKKMLSAALLVFALLLSACGEALPMPNGNHTTITIETKQEVSLVAEPPQEQDGPLKGAVMLTDVDGIMGRATAWTEDGMYQLASWGPEGGANLTFYDYQTHTRNFLCNQPGCSHSNETCPGWFSPNACAGGAGLFTDGEALYLLRLGSGVEAGKPETITETSYSTITRMDFDGGNREVVLEMGSAEFIWGAVAKTPGGLYFLRETLMEKDGATQTLRQMVFFDIATRAVTPIAEFDLNTYFVGICEQGFVMKSLVDQPDGTLLHTVSLYRVETGESEMVKQWNGMNIVAQATNGNLYYVDTHTAELGAIDLDTKNVTVITNTLPLNEDDMIRRCGIFDGRFMFSIAEHGVDTVETTKQYAVGLEDGSVSQNTLQFDFMGVTNPVFIMAENSTHFLVHYSNKLIMIPSTGPDGRPFEFERQEEQIAIISKEDYWNNNPNYTPIENTDNFLYR